MAVNKVDINGATVLDLTGDSVTPETLLQGATAHDASGAAIEGTAALDVTTETDTDITGLLKGADGKVAAAEPGVDYMPPVPVTAEDNGKFLQVKEGAWAPSEKTVEDLEGYATEAKNAAAAAAKSESAAKTYRDSANTYKNNAMAYANNSYSYSKNAETYKNSAKSYVASCKKYDDSCYDYWDETNEYWKDVKAMTASIKGYYPTVEAMKAAWPSPTEEMYCAVGTAEPYAIWYWNTYDQDWFQRQQVHDLARKSFVLFSSTAGSQKRFRVTVDDNSTVSISNADTGAAVVEFPAVTAGDDGKVLTVSNGKWVAASLPVYTGGVS